MNINPYYDEASVQREIEVGGHREAVGGMWDVLGRHQLDFLIAHGLAPGHRLLDVGCGALRLGVHAVRYLDPGHYFGLDISPGLLDAGYSLELDEAERSRVPRSNLAANADFDCGFLAGPVDMAIAQSLFTHLPLNHIRRCLTAVAGALRPGCTLYGTAWILPPGTPVTRPFAWAGEINGEGITTSDISDPYHYGMDDLRFAVKELPLSMSLIGDWGHPRGQPMLSFKRT